MLHLLCQCISFSQEVWAIDHIILYGLLIIDITEIQVIVCEQWNNLFFIGIDNIIVDNLFLWLSCIFPFSMFSFKLLVYNDDFRMLNETSRILLHLYWPKFVNPLVQLELPLCKLANLEMKYVNDKKIIID